MRNRGTSVEIPPIAFLESFYDNPIKKDKWNAFLKDISHEPISLETVMDDLRGYFTEILKPNEI